jgi:hypothetical protein
VAAARARTGAGSTVKHLLQRLTVGRLLCLPLAVLLLLSVTPALRLRHGGRHGGEVAVATQTATAGAFGNNNRQQQAQAQRVRDATATTTTTRVTPARKTDNTRQQLAPRGGDTPHQQQQGQEEQEQAGETHTSDEMLFPLEEFSKGQQPEKRTPRGGGGAQQQQQQGEAAEQQHPAARRRAAPAPA